MIIAELKIAVGFIDPDHSAARITDQVVVKKGWPNGCRLAETGDQVAVITGCVKIKEVLVNLNPVGNKLNKLSGGFNQNGRPDT